MAKENGCETLLPSNDIFKMKNTLQNCYSDLSYEGTFFIVSALE